MNFAVISASLNPRSRSRVLARRAADQIEKAGESVDWIDLQEVGPLPLCDGGAAYNDPKVQQLDERIANAAGILMAAPIYNYYVNAAAKNVVELTGYSWKGKVVGFLGAAGGKSSYMSMMDLANSLMLDFRCIIVPRFVYSVKADVDGDSIVNEEIARRADELAAELVRITKGISD